MNDPVVYQWDAWEPGEADIEAYNRSQHEVFLHPEPAIRSGFVPRDESLSQEDDFTMRVKHRLGHSMEAVPAYNVILSPIGTFIEYGPRLVGWQLRPHNRQSPPANLFYT